MRIVSVLIAAALAPVLLAQAPPLKPGQYEIVSEFSMPGRPGGVPGQKILHCYTAQELQDMANALANRDPKQSCKVQDSKMSGSTLTFTTVCTNPDGRQLTTSGEMTFTSQESYHGVVRMTSTGRAANPALGGMTITMTGKRIGDCTK